MSDRYARQMVLPEVGADGQARLGASSVLVIGAGGLGCAVLQYLAAAGVGRIVIVDHDRIEESNLHRQPLFRMSELGQAKATAAREALRQLNPQIAVEARVERLSPANVAPLTARADLIIDAADSLAATYISSDECMRARKPLVSASALGLSGYVGAFCAGAPSYRAVFPEMPRQAGSCSEAGVLGTVVGVMGTLQAHMTLALLLGLQPSPLAELVSIDFRALRFGGFSFKGAAEPAGRTLAFISPHELAEGDIAVDLRSLEEAPVSPIPNALRLRVEEVERGDRQFPAEARVVLCCRSGVRAWRAARALERQGHYHLALVAFGG
ncbi:MAG: ThiF family adenylyltransferase [Steroidobacteraceae bacterium]